MKDFLAAWNALPVGTSTGTFRGHRYSITRSERNGGRRAWLWAEQLGGTDRISANLFRLASGIRLRPCEMTAEKVKEFVLNVEPLTQSET